MLLRGVAEVAAFANPDEPGAVTHRAFDAARERSAAHANLPRARQVTERLGLPWSEVLELAQLPVHTQQRRLSKKDGEEEQDWVNAEHVAAVLGIVAGRLGVTTLTQVQYSAERDRIRAENKRRKAALLLPTTEQIRFAMRRELHGDPHRATPTRATWDRALELAGLEATRNRRGRSSPWGRLSCWNALTKPSGRSSRLTRLRCSRRPTAFGTRKSGSGSGQ